MTSFELPATHVHLAANGAAELLESAQLWERPPAELDNGLPNWLVASFPIAVDDSPGAAEIHPNGDELLCAVAGAIDVILEDSDKVQVVTLRPGQTCLVPKGTWHRLRGRVPGNLITITYGRGTQHR